ncbi:MAG: glycoside hydrolase domain-containing protein [Sedimentisphaerales bacterium]
MKKSIVVFACLVLIICSATRAMMLADKGSAAKRPLRFRIMADEVPAGWGNHIPKAEEAYWGWWSDYRRPSVAEIPEAGVDTSNGFVLWHRSNSEPVFQNSAPKAAEVISELKGYACKGEYDRIIFEVYAVVILKKVRVEVTELKGPDGFVISKLFLEPRWPVYETESGRPGYLVRPPKEASIPSGRNQQVWICFKVPVDAKPGLYHGQVSISAEGLRSIRLPIQIEVYPFDLVPSSLANGFWYSNISSAHAPIDLDDMREMGMTAVGFTGVPIPFYHTAGLDLSGLERAIKLLQKHGFAKKDGPKSCWYNYAFRTYDSGYLMSDKLNPKKIVQTFVAIEKLYQKHPGWPDLIVCLTDELGWEEKPRLRNQNKKFFEEHPEKWPKPGQRLLSARRTGQMIKSLNLKRVEPAFIANRRQALEVLSPVFGGYCNLSAQYGAQDIEKMTEDGLEFYTYNTWRSRIAFGYYNWKCSLHGSKGNLQWGYGWSDHKLVVRIGDRRLHHVTYEQMAEGTDDVRYLNTCEEWIKKDPTKSAARAAQALLDEIAGHLELPWTYGPAGRRSKNFWKQDLCDRYRRKIATAIMAIMKQAD